MGKSKKGIKPKVNFDAKLQNELESIINVSTQTNLEGMQQKVFQDRYSLKDVDGNQVEQYPEEMWRRVAAGIAQVEKGSKKRKEWATKFYDVLQDFKFVPAGRILSGAGTSYDVTFYNCFVLPSPHDSRNGILDNLKIMVDIFSRSGGAGINLSSLRPRGSRVKKVNGWSSGPVNWAELYSTATHDVIQQGGTRRGALMLMINDWHPDMEEFIEVKKDLSKINGANLSICVSDAFMEAVKNDSDWDLIFPDTNDPDYDRLWDGDIEKWKATGKKVDVRKTVKAAQVWDKICKAAWSSAEPGIHFIDRSNNRSNTWYFEKLISTNPCGEQPLGAWAVCNLGSVSLPAFVDESKMDFEKLADTVKIAIRFMDNVIDTTGYYFKENSRQQSAIRRVGLSGMGLGDALIKLKLRYGSKEAEPVVEKIYKTIRDAAYEASSQLAIEKGAFPNFDKEKYMQGWFIKKLPKDIREKIQENGVRNAVLLTQAPTGTTSLLSGVSSGIEPVYDFAMTRRDRTGEHVIYHRLYKEWMEAHPNETPPEYFVSANDLTPEEHVKAQAIIQEYTDSSISKTVNAPNAHTIDDVKRLYTQAYDLGCKGVTYMRDGSREGVLSHGTGKKEEKGAVANGQTNLNGETKQENTPVYLRKRTDNLQGITRKVDTPVGPAFVTINSDEEGNPFEVFINVGKAGSDITADAEALGRLMSLALRIPSAYPPREVARKVAYQLSGIGGASQRGFGSSRVHSLADAVSKVVYDYLDKQELPQHTRETLGNEKVTGNGKANGNGQTISEPEKEGEKSADEVKEPVESEPSQQLTITREKSRRDLCPKCGVASFVYEEGCKKCYSCGHSEC